MREPRVALWRRVGYGIEVAEPHVRELLDAVGGGGLQGVRPSQKCERSPAWPSPRVLLIARRVIPARGSSGRWPVSMH